MKHANATAPVSGAPLTILDRRHFVLAVVSAGVLLRLLVLAYLAHFPLQGDALTYHEMGTSLARGEAFAPFYPPGFPYFLAAVYRVVGPGELVARATGVLWFLALAVLAYRMAHLVGGRRAAGLTVLMLVVFPVFVWHSAEPLTQLPTAVYLLLVCDLTVSALRAPRWRTLALLGVVLGVAVITRPTCLLLALVVPLILLVASKRIRTAIVPLALCSLVVGAWLVKADAMTGRFVFINDANAKNLFYGNNAYTPLYKTWWFGSHFEGDVGVPAGYTDMLEGIEQQPEAEQNRRFREEAFRHVRSRPELFLLRTVNRACVFFAFDTFTGSALREFYGVPTLAALAVIAVDALCYCLLVVACILFLFTRPISTPVRVMLAVILSYSLPYWFSFSHPTYHIPIVPLAAVIGCAFLQQLASTSPRNVVSASFSSRRRAWLIAALVSFALIQAEWVAFNVTRI